MSFGFSQMWGISKNTMKMPVLRWRCLLHLCVSRLPERNHQRNVRWMQLNKNSWMRSRCEALSTTIWTDPLPPELLRQVGRQTGEGVCPAGEQVRPQILMQTFLINNPSFVSLCILESGPGRAGGGQPTERHSLCNHPGCQMQDTPRRPAHSFCTFQKLHSQIRAQHRSLAMSSAPRFSVCLGVSSSCSTSWQV